MNDPIISPWLIYLLELINTLKVIFSIAGILGITICIAALIIENKLFLKHFILAVVISIIGILIPTQKTLIAMIAAKHITPANVTRAVETGKDIKEEIKKDIIEILQQVEKERK